MTNNEHACNLTKDDTLKYSIYVGQIDVRNFNSTKSKPNPPRLK